MGSLTSPVILSSAVVIVAALCYKKAMTPPNARADKTVRVDDGVGRVIPQDFAIPMAVASNWLVCVHLAFEAYALLSTSKHSHSSIQGPDISSICLLSGPSTTQSIYPAGRLSLTGFLPLALIIVAGVFRNSCHHTLGKMFTWDTSILKDHKLITNGPYQFVRHPSYTGFVGVTAGYIWFLFVPGTFMRECLIGPDFPAANSFTTKSAMGIAYALTWTFLYIDTSVFLVKRSLTEDGMMKKEFGKEWESWAQKVRWRVFPYVL